MFLYNYYVIIIVSPRVGCMNSRLYYSISHPIEWKRAAHAFQKIVVYIQLQMLTRPLYHLVSPTLLLLLKTALCHPLFISNWLIMLTLSRWKIMNHRPFITYRYCCAGIFILFLKMKTKIIIIPPWDVFWHFDNVSIPENRKPTKLISIIIQCYKIT